MQTALDQQRAGQQAQIKWHAKDMQKTSRDIRRAQRCIF